MRVKGIFPFFWRMFAHFALLERSYPHIGREKTAEDLASAVKLRPYKSVLKNRGPMISGRRKGKIYEIISAKPVCSKIAATVSFCPLTERLPSPTSLIIKSRTRSPAEEI